MKRLKSWFFRNLAKEILILKPEYEISAPDKKRLPIAAFESDDLWLDKLREANEKDAGHILQSTT